MLGCRPNLPDQHCSSSNIEWLIVPNHSVLPFLGQQECGHTLLFVSYLVTERATIASREREEHNGNGGAAEDWLESMG